MMSCLRAAAWSGVVCCIAAAGVSTARADLQQVRSEVAELESSANQLATAPLRKADLRSRTYVVERLADGELFFRLEDYVRAAIIFTDVVENYPEHRAAGDALFLLGESLFRAGDYLGARTRFRELIEKADRPGYSTHVAQALGRLLEIAIHTQDFEGVEEHFERLSRLPPREVEAATNYFRAKYLYNRAVAEGDLRREDMEAFEGHMDVARLEQARQAFEVVRENSPYFPQARYFVGVILTLQRQYPAAVDAFRRVLRAPANSPEAERVLELAQLALGRLYYETKRSSEAIEAYQAISRTSTYFDVALYEIAWVYIRQGDAQRADRALEVLAIAVPDSRYQADAEILRGNLLLREGRLLEAREVFNSAIASYEPIRDQLDEMIANRPDPAEHFRELVRRNIDVFDASTLVPAEALKYASDEANIDRALGVLSDLNQARTLVREATDIIQRLDAAISSDNRGNVFPDLRAQRQRTTGLRNRAAAARRALIDLEASKMSGAGGELGDLRRQRLQLERELKELPQNAEDFADRDEVMLGGFRKSRKELSDLDVQVMGLEARIVATERFLADSNAGAANPDGTQAILDELTTQRAAVEEYRERIREYRFGLEAGSSQVGVGDARYRRDDSTRSQYNELVQRERNLMAAQGLSPNPEVDALYRRLDGVDAIVNRRDEEIESVVEQRVGEMRTVLAEESTNVEGYRTQLADLEEESEDVVGGLAYASFRAVRHRFYKLVLQADVGKIDVSWADREEHRTRVEQLSRERAQELKALDDEFNAIIDKGEPGGG